MARLTESELVEIARRAVEKYAGGSPHARIFSILDDLRQVYAVTGIEKELGEDYSWILLQAHVEDGFIVVDVDNIFDKKLVYALEQAGVPREQIVLAYEGETIPKPTEQSS
jgi:hypothetical protein